MTRQEALELLPWHVAGSLSTEESQAVQTFIDKGEISSGALAELTLVAGEVGSVAVGEPAYRSRLLDDVLARLDETPQEPITGRPAPSGIWFRLLDRLQWGTTPTFARWALGAQFAAMTGLVAGLALMLTADPARPAPEVAYETVAGPVSIANFSVAFAPDATEMELRSELQRLGLSIVDGPSALGLYRLAATDGADLSALEAALVAAPVVTLVQPEALR